MTVRIDGMLRIPGRGTVLIGEVLDGGTARDIDRTKRLTISGYDYKIFGVEFLQYDMSTVGIVVGNQIRDGDLTYPVIAGVQPYEKEEES